MELPPNNWKLIVKRSEIKEAVTECAKFLNDKFKDDHIVLTCILKGAMYFCRDLSVRLTVPHSLYFLEVSSYKEGRHQGELEILSRIVKDKFKGKKVVLVDELFDNGHTMRNTAGYISQETGIPFNDIFTCVAMIKNKKTPYQPDYSCLKVPDVWLVGYGLDDNQAKRNWKNVWACPKIEGIPKSPDDAIFDSDDAYQEMRDTIRYE